MLSSSQGRDTKLDTFFVKNQHVLEGDLLFFWTLRKCQNLTVKDNFLKNHRNLSDFFSKTILCYWHFFITSMFKSLCFLNDAPFLKVRLYMYSQNIKSSLGYVDNFVSLPWKLNNPYCHNSTMASESKHRTVVSDEFCHSCSKPPIKILSQALQSKVWLFDHRLFRYQ